jgi:hypothetical protein
VPIRLILRAHVEDEKKNLPKKNVRKGRRA